MQLLEILFMTAIGWSASLGGVDFSAEKIIAGKKLILNGPCMRSKNFVLFEAEVYVAGLYASGKVNDSEQVIRSTEPQLMEMVFMRDLKKAQLTEAWQKGIEKNCTEQCESVKDQLASFNGLMSDVKKGERLKLSFDDQGVTVELVGKESKSGRIAGLSARRNLMAIFIGKQPPTEQFKSCLLSGK